MNKLKIGIVGVAAVAILVLIGAYLQARMREKDKALAEQTDRATQLEAENKRLSNLIVDAKSSTPQPAALRAAAVHGRLSSSAQSTPSRRTLTR